MMNKKEIFRKIGGIISELTEQYQYLSENLDDLSDLELELFMANSRFLTDHAEILKKLNVKPSGSAAPQTAYQNPEAVPAHAAEPVEENEVEENEKETEKPEPAEAPAPSALHEEKSAAAEEEIKPDLEAEPAENEEDEPESWSDAAAFQEEEEQSNKKSEPQAVTAQAEPAVAERPQAEPEKEETVQEVVIPQKTVSVEMPPPAVEPAVRPTLNDLISARKNQNAATGINRPPQIKDLKSAISLNDKLMFIKELFNGYSLAYSEAIEILNRFETFEAADAFLKTNYAEKNNWIAKEPIVDKLYELLRSRYTI